MERVETDTHCLEEVVGSHSILMVCVVCIWISQRIDGCVFFVLFINEILLVLLWHLIICRLYEESLIEGALSSSQGLCHTWRPDSHLHQSQAANPQVTSAIMIYIYYWWFILLLWQWTVMDLKTHKSKAFMSSPFMHGVRYSREIFGSHFEPFKL